MMTERRYWKPARLFALLLAVNTVVRAQEPAPKAESATVEVQGATVGRMGEPAESSPEQVHFSQAETLLWLTNHLENISKPARLYYQFTKSGTYEEGFTDSVYLDVVKINDDGSRDTNLQFFTGQREQPFSGNNVTGVRGNPVLGVYLQGDVLDMNRLTQGNWRYFQRRIKMAISGNAVIEPASFQYDGHEVKGERISITPYVHDPREGQFQQFAGKRYEFLMSDQVPGTLYQIHTVVPGKTADGKPLIEETLTLQSVNYNG